MFITISALPILFSLEFLSRRTRSAEDGDEPEKLTNKELFDMMEAKNASSTAEQAYEELMKKKVNEDNAPKVNDGHISLTPNESGS